MGGYLAWETARQLLAQGEVIASLAFFEVPLHKTFAAVPTGPMPVDSANLWRLGHYYRPEPLPVALTHLMTHPWHGANWWRSWQHVALRGTETVLLPDGDTQSQPARLASAIHHWSLAVDATFPT